MSALQGFACLGGADTTERPRNVTANTMVRIGHQRLPENRHVGPVQAVAKCNGSIAPQHGTPAPAEGRTRIPAFEFAAAHAQKSVQIGGAAFVVERLECAAAETRLLRRRTDILAEIA